jgi:hypothetical protein
MQHINFARQPTSKDSSPLRSNRNGKFNSKQLKRLVTCQDEKPSNRIRVGASLELDHTSGLQTSTNQKYQRSRSDASRKEEFEDFGYDESPLLPAERLGHTGAEDSMFNKASKNRYNLRRMPPQQRSLLLDK